MKINRKKTVQVDAKVLKIHCKPCDAGSYELLDAQGESIIAAHDAYVPHFLGGESSDDYLVLDIDLETGGIIGWKPPKSKDIEAWIAAQEGDDD